MIPLFLLMWKLKFHRAFTAEAKANAVAAAATAAAAAAVPESAVWQGCHRYSVGCFSFQSWAVLLSQ